LTQLAELLAGNGYDPGEVGYLARTGWTTGDLRQALNEIDVYPPYQFVSLLIRVNNQFRGLSFSVFERESPLVLERVVQLAGGNRGRAFVLSIPVYRYTPFGSRAAGVDSEICRYNEFIEWTCSAQGVRYFYIAEIAVDSLTDPSLIAGDGLHSSGESVQQDSRADPSRRAGDARQQSAPLARGPVSRS